MQYKHISFLLFLSLPIFLFGQKSIPGFLGKRNLVSLNYIGGIVKKDPFTNYNQYYTQNPNLQLSYERVLNRKKSILLSISHGGFKVSNSYLYDIYSLEKIIQNGKAYEIYDGTIDFNVTSFHLSSHIYMRNKGALAPLGKYFVYGFSHSLINIKKTDLLYYDNSNNPLKLPNISHSSISLNTFFIGFGSKRFISNNIFINKMIQFNLPLNFYSSTFNTDYITPVQRVDLENNIAKFAFSRQNTLNFSIGVGTTF